MRISDGVVAMQDDRLRRRQSRRRGHDAVRQRVVHEAEPADMVGGRRLRSVMPGNERRQTGIVGAKNVVDPGAGGWRHLAQALGESQRALEQQEQHEQRVKLDSPATYPVLLTRRSSPIKAGRLVAASLARRLHLDRPVAAYNLHRMTGFGLQAIRNDIGTRFLAATLCAFLLLSTRGAIASGTVSEAGPASVFCSFDSSLPPLVPDHTKAPAPERTNAIGHCALCIGGGGPALPPPANIATFELFADVHAPDWRVVNETISVSAAVSPNAARGPPSRA